MTTTRPQQVDEQTWEALTALAREACAAAYVPYSGFPVGAAALVDDGRHVSGCNVENAGYGVTLCAECGLVSDLVRGGGGRLVAFVCVGGDGRALSPCGRCRQLLAEHAAPGMILAVPGGRRTIEEMLPLAFGVADLERAGSPTGLDPTTT
ncbi:MAG: cytidine deaminase [Actinomycetaceae bacterium]